MENLKVDVFAEKISNDPDAIIVDVRGVEEEVEGLIKNSININIMDPSFPDKVRALDKEKNYYVYCRSGGRSASACEFMESNGYTAFNLIGGITAWNTLK